MVPKVNWVPWFQKQIKAPIPVCVGLATSDVGERLGTDFLYIDRSYWDRPNRFRIIRGAIHLQTVLDRPADRDPPAVRPWRTEGSFVAVIPPSRWQCERIPGAKGWLETLDLQTDREVRIKHDKEVPLEGYLEGAWAVVSYGSVAAVKAATWGYPVLSGPHCPAKPVDCESIESPVLKDRGPWLRSLSYAQWTPEEVATMDFGDYDYSRRDHCA